MAGTPLWESDGVRETVVGTVVWAVGLASSLLLLGTLRDHGLLWFVPTCAVGLALGLLGVAYCRRRASAVARGARTDLF